MPNLHRGEIEAEIGGVRRRLVLTLGALAELEAAFGVEDLTALAERFGTGRLRARDLIRIIGAGLRGAGETISDDDVARLSVDGGAPGLCAYRRGAACGDLRRGGDREPPFARDGARVARAPFPWKQAMGFGFSVLRLAPDAFWAMTPRELAAAMETVWGTAERPLDRATFVDLRTRFPDAPAA